MNSHGYRHSTCLLVALCYFILKCLVFIFYGAYSITIAMNHLISSLPLATSCRTGSRQKTTATATARLTPRLSKINKPSNRTVCSSCSDHGVGASYGITMVITKNIVFDLLGSFLTPLPFSNLKNYIFFV